MSKLSDERLREIAARVESAQGDAEFIAHARTDVPDLIAEVKRLREVVAVADRVAASLGLVLHDAHPTYGSTALWRGGVGGQALTSHCSIIDGAHPGGEWAEFDLPSHYLREWVSLRGADYDHNEMKATVRADLLALLNPTEGGDDDSVQAH